jgi:hypothetical protein
MTQSAHLNCNWLEKNLQGGWIWPISYSLKLVSQLLLHHPYFQGGGWGKLAFSFSVDHFAHQNNRTVTKLIKLQQNSSNILTLVSTTRVSTTIPPLSITLMTKIDDVN